jgi:hypothetical protein
MIYARSDIQAITVSDAHGGCGVLHERPEGERAWGLECGVCEGHLRTDPMWTTRRDEIPETHDEKANREAMERNANRIQIRATEEAAGLIALLTGPRDLLAGQAPALAAGGVECRRCGTTVRGGARFCDECGGPVLLAIGETGVA